MTLHEISKIAKDGDKVARPNLRYILKWGDPYLISVPFKDALADDWEIVKKKVKKIGWVNVYKTEKSMRRTTGNIFDSQEIAIADGDPVARVAITRIEWEEEE